MFSMAQERSQMMPVVQDSLWGTIGNAQDRMENWACSQSILLDMSWCSGSSSYLIHVSGFQGQPGPYCVNLYGNF